MPPYATQREYQLGRGNLWWQIITFMVKSSVSAVKNHPSVRVKLFNYLRWNSHIGIIKDKGKKSLGYVRHNLYPHSDITNALLTLPLWDLIWSMSQLSGTLNDMIRMIHPRQSNDVQVRFIKGHYSTGFVTSFLLFFFLLLIGGIK